MSGESTLGATCSKCREWKSAGHFYRDPKKRNGLNSWCKPCHNEDRFRRMRQTRGVKHAETLFDEVCRDLLPADLYASVLAEAERRQREYGGGAS
jgi:hypothetical protein